MTSSSLTALLLVGWLLTLAGCGAGGGGNAANDTAAIRTLAYVDTECSENAAGAGVLTQSVRVLVGDGPARTVYSVGPIEFPPPPFHFCEMLGWDRFGAETVTYGALARIGVSPDGSGVVFEVSDIGLQTLGGVGTFGGIGGVTLPAASQGIFYVRSDGTGLRRLGDPSRVPSFGVDIFGFFGPFLDVNFGFSPDSRTITFPDLGPGPSGEEAIQIFTLDVVSGERPQVTRLPSLPKDVAPYLAWGWVPATSFPFFLDAGNIAFFTETNPDGLNPGYNLLGFTIGGDGKLTPAHLPMTRPGSQIVPKFAITGPEPGAAILPVYQLPGELVPVAEVFLLDGDSLLQLTNFGREDTTTALVGVDRERVFFNASADPLGANPSKNCQIFSIDRTGADLRQLTHFRESGEGHALQTCFYNSRFPYRYGCVADFLWQDPVTQTLVFNSSCDPFGEGYYGAQIFAMRPDGSGLRQLTDTQGVVPQNPALTVSVWELPGPFAYSAQIRPLRVP